MENFDGSEIGSESTAHLTNTMKNYLVDSAKWAKFLSIVGFVFIGIILIGALSFGFILELIGEASPFGLMGSFNPGIIIIGMYILMTGICFFPIYYLFNFSTGILKNIP